jgi:hypothetical protein
VGKRFLLVVSLGISLVVACSGSSGTSRESGDDEPSAGEAGRDTSSGASAGASAGASGSGGAGGDAAGGDAAASGAGPDAGGSTSSGGSAGTSGGAAGASSGSSGESGAGALGGTTGTSGAGGAGGASGAGATSGASGNMGVAGSPPDGCTKRTQQVGFASRRLIVMMDRSASLLENVAGTDVSAWDTVTAAFASLIQAPASAELGLALRFFPHDQPAVGCSDPVCDFEACHGLLIPMGTLTSASGSADPQENALIGAITSSPPNADDQGGTPLHPALYGAFMAATEYQANSLERTTVVLVTDGAPNGCDEDLDSLLDVAQHMLQQAGIGTYVVGLPDTRHDLELEHLAQFGGSVLPVYSPGSRSLAPDLESAFTYLRDAWSVCGFELPLQYAGYTLAYDTAFVSISTYGGTPVVIPRLSSAADCGSSSGYTVDASAFPDKLEFCPASCEAARAPGAMVEVLLDECPTTGQ